MKSAWVWLEELDQKLGKHESVGLCSSLPIPKSSYQETFILTALFGSLIYFLVQPAFSGFIYGEEFISKWLYLSAGENFFRAIFTPFSVQFFRPTSIAWSMSTSLLLPWDIDLLHFRNFFFTLVNLFLLHRIMLRLVSSPLARFLGLTFFAVSKVQLSIIGMTSLIDNIGALVYFLLTLLFLLRYFQQNNKLDYLLAFLFSALSFFARDFSIVLGAVIFVLFVFYAWECTEKSKSWYWTGLKFLPFMLVACLYLAVRFSLARPEAGGDGYYSIKFDWQQVWSAGWVFIGNLFNLSLFTPIITGQGDLSTLLTNNAAVNQVYKMGFLMLATGLLAWTCLRGVWYKKWSSFALIWAIVMISPTFLISNLQTYYIYEPVAAIAVLLGLTLDHHIPGRRILLGLWAPTLLVIGLNGYAHNQNINVLTWYHVQKLVDVANQDMFIPNRGRPIRSLTILTATQEQANFISYLLSPFGPPHALLKTLLAPEVNEFQARIDGPTARAELNDLKSMDLVYRFVNPGYAPVPLSVPKSTCNSFEDQSTELKPAQILNTETHVRIQHNPTYASAGSQSIEVTVVAVGPSGPHYGGVEFALPQKDFVIDFGISRPQNLKAVFVYEMNQAGEPIYAWVNENPGQTLMAEQNLTLVFQTGSRNEFGFHSQPMNQLTSPPQAIRFFVEVKGHQNVVFYLDQLCELKMEP